jgi:hypothetical protein
VVLTPSTREFLDRLQDLFDAKERLGVAADQVEVTIVEDGARIVIPARVPGARGIAVEVAGRDVVIVYGPEAARHVDHHDEALAEIGDFLDGRIDLTCGHVWVANVYRTYRDGQCFRTRWAPTLTFRSNTERFRFFAT